MVWCRFQLKFYPSRLDSGSIHLMGYSAEESAQRAEKIIFEVYFDFRLEMSFILEHL